MKHSIHTLNALDDMGSHTSKCTISSIPLALLSLLGNVLFALFHCAHPLQIPSCFAWISRSPKTTLLATGGAL